MTPKKVWGVVLIVLGVVAVINGLGNIGAGSSDIYGVEDLLSLRSGIESLDQLAIQTQNQYEEAMESAFWSGCIGGVVGICLSVAGTLMLKDGVFNFNRASRKILVEEKIDWWKK